jgi:hypothetical protein
VLRRVIILTAVSTLIGPLSTATAATTDETFTRQANAICAQEGAKVTALPEVTDENAVVVLGQLTGIISELARRLDLVAAPPAKAAKFRTYLVVTRQSVTYVRRTITAIKRHDPAGTRTWMRKALAADARGNKLAAQLGLTDCAKDY